MIDVGAIHKALKDAGLTIVGVSQPPEPHLTAVISTFIKVGDQLVRVDWQATPSSVDESEAAEILNAMIDGDVKYILSSVPR